MAEEEEEQVKSFRGDEVIHGWFSTVWVGFGRLKGLVSTTTTFTFFFFIFLVGTLVWMDIPILRGTPFSLTPKIHHETIQYPFNCPNSSTNHSSVFNPKESSTKTCPDYFRYIHQDLKQWNSSGITQNMIERGKPMAEHDWNARLYKQDWGKEIAQGFKHSKLEDQCTHRYKIYIEGRTWSVSQKYILACDSMTLMIKPKYYDFFSRSLVPMQHYWPIRSRKKCKHIKFAVEWGNNHTREAQAIGKAGSKLVEELLAMRNVYDYMFHLLNEYSKLLRFKPKIPSNAQRLCAETTEYGVWRDFMMQSMVKSPSEEPPCELPPPFEPQDIRAKLETKEKLTRQAETWETEYWKERKHHKKH